MEKERAKEKYEDAVSSGHTAVLAQEDEEKSENIKLIIGNLLPNQEAQVHLQLTHILRVEAAAYCLRVPQKYFPSFVKSTHNYSYNYEVVIDTSSPINYVSYPPEAILTKSEESKIGQKQVTIEKREENISSVNRDLTIYYRTQDMEQTVLFSQESPDHPDEIATMMTFVPSFIQKQSDPTAFESCEDEMPDPQDLPMMKEDKNFLFIFLVDRSGSMSGSKMTTTN